MGFTFNPTTKRGKVRLLIADTNADDPDRQIFTNEEIDAFLALENNEIYPAAAAACRSIAASASKSAIAWRSLDRRIDKKDVPTHYRDLASDYRDRAVQQAPAEEVAEMAFDFSDLGGDRTEYEGDLVW